MHDSARRNPNSRNEATTKLTSVEDSDGAGSILTTTTTVSSVVVHAEMADNDNNNEDTYSRENMSELEYFKDFDDEDDEQLQLIILQDKNSSKMEPIARFRCQRMRAATRYEVECSEEAASQTGEQRVASIALRLAQSQAMAVAGFLPKKFYDNVDRKEDRLDVLQCVKYPRSVCGLHGLTGLPPSLQQRDSFHGCSGGGGRCREVADAMSRRSVIEMNAFKGHHINSSYTSMIVVLS